MYINSNVGTNYFSNGLTTNVLPLKKLKNSSLFYKDPQERGIWDWISLKYSHINDMT